VVVVAARRQPGRLDPDLVWAVEDDVEAQDVSVEVGGPLEVGHLQVHVAIRTFGWTGGSLMASCLFRLSEGRSERASYAIHPTS
jgi:hypothetical protein